jgi:hypothetical protein
MSEGGDVLDIIRDDIKEFLLDKITKYTGVHIVIEEIDIVD